MEGEGQSRWRVGQQGLILVVVCLWLCGCVVLWVRDSICVYILPYHSIFLHMHLGKSGKCWLKPTQTATTSSVLCRQHGPIWPKLEQHQCVVPTRHDMSATFPAKPNTPGKLFTRKGFSCPVPHASLYC